MTHVSNRHRFWGSIAFLLLGSIVLALLTFVCFRFHARLAIVALLYLVVILLISLQGRFVVALLCSVVAVFCLDYYLTHQLFSLPVTQPEGIAAFFTFLTAALVVTTLVSRMRKSYLELVQENNERKRAEEELRRSEAFLAQGQRISQTGSWGWQVATGAIYWSKEHFRIFGYDPETDKPSYTLFLERIHQEDRAPVEGLLNRAVRHKSDFENEYRIVLPDGSIKFLWSVGRALASPSGELEFIGTVMDITERKRAENEIRQLNASLERRVAERTIELVRSERLLRESEARLRESEQRFSRAFTASQALMTIARLSDGKFVEVNDSFARWFGLDRESILGHDSWELGLWLNLDDRTNFWADLRLNGSVREVECRFRTRRGTVHTVLVSADIVEVNREPHVLGFFLDVTERKRVESELLRTVAREKELGQLRSNFVSMVSHEFRTPLGIIQSSAEILEDYLEQLKPAERVDHLQSIRKNIRRMAATMEEVLLIGSFDAGKMEFKPAALDLQAFARSLAEEVLSATNRRCPIELSLSEMPAKIQTDERLLRYIFTNLLANAVKYSDAERVVRFEVGCTETEIACVVRDEGIGIPAADREWLFTPFHRGQNVGERSGTGLGLVIVKRCVDLHGGKINVESKFGEGTSVTVTLPIVSRESRPAS